MSPDSLPPFEDFDDLLDHLDRIDQRPGAFDRLRDLGSEVGYMRATEGERAFVWVDSQARTTLGIDPAEVLEDAGAWDSRVHPIEGVPMPTVLDGSDPTRMRFHWVCADGEMVTMEEHATLARDHDGTLLRVGVVRSIEELARAEARLAGEKERLELVLEGTRLGLWDWDMVEDAIQVNKRWATILGHTLNEVQPVTVTLWRSMIHPDDLAESDELVERHIDGDTAFYDIEYRMKHRKGHWVWVHDRGKVVEWTTEGRPLRMTGTREDVTRRHESEAALRDQMLLDPLTGLGNRRMMDARLDDLVTEARTDGTPFGVVVIDVDHFKQVNDNHGHLLGDAALKAVASCIAGAVRPSDIALRQAGDEFGVLLPGADLQGMAVVAQRLLDAVRAADILSDVAGESLTVSVGTAHSDEVATIDEESVVRLADQRLYAAKRSGRNRASTH